MGQHQTYQKKSLVELIKDIDQFNKLLKTHILLEELECSISADVIKNKQSFREQLMSLHSKQEQTIVLYINGATKHISEQKFYEIRQLTQDLASVLMTNREEGICQICFEQQINKMLPCGHSYCEVCIEGWFTEKDRDSCPMCRTQITKQKMISDSYCVPNDREFVESIKIQLNYFLN